MRIRIALLLLLAVLALPGLTVTLTQLISREHPSLDVAGAHLAVGRDGMVYLASGDYVLRLARDGAHKLGSKVTYAMWNVAANADGVIATANAHFNHSVNVWSPKFDHIGQVSDFLSSDPTEWFGPDDVQVGASGDFFGMDQNRNRIVRVKTPGVMSTTYSLTGTGENFIGHLCKFRVWEPGKRFYVCNSTGLIYALDFAGTLAWKLDAGIGGDPWNGYNGSFDVDDAGTLYVMHAAENVVKRYGPDGKPAGEVTLALPDKTARVTDLRVFGDDIVIKRNSPTELFMVFDRTTGALRRVVNAELERLEVTYPADVWTAGQPVPLTIAFTAPNPAVRPRWRVWLRPFNTPRFVELPVKDGAVTPPADAGGLYQLRVSPGLDGAAAEYVVQSVVEIRQPGAKGTLSLLTPNNRMYYGQGEEIPISLVSRTKTPAALPATLAVQLRSGATTVLTLNVTPNPNATATLTRAQTAALAPGAYLLTAVAPGFTVAAQPLLIGPGIAAPSPFSLVQHGDYSLAFPTGSYFDVPEKLAAHLARSTALHTNMFVDRLGGGYGLGGLTGGPGTDALVEKLKTDPAGTAPEKAQIENPEKATLAGYGAMGIEERGILLSMDAGLPIGTLYDSRTMAQDIKDLTTATTAMLPYPAFRGWSWAANWWLAKHGSAAADTPEQKAAYDAAFKAANDTGAWAPVLDTVSDLWLHYAIDAEKGFHDTLTKLAPGKISAITGPYRAVTVIPPLTFAGADEVDLQYQSEQIQPPQVTPHNVDFYKRPGKRAWGHPELWNDDGTGNMIYPTLFQMVMRGADGVGGSGSIPAWGTPPSDPRATGVGIVSVMRGFDTLLAHYGPWLTTLQAHDPVAIVVSGRMLRLDDWKSIGGLYFDRLFEAYNACLYAHRPAHFVFSDDLTPDALTGYKAILVIGQRVELEPELHAALIQAQAAGALVRCDGNCRPALLPEFKALGITFNHLETDPSAWQDDSAYVRFPGYFKEHAAALNTALAAVPPIAITDNPELMLTERVSGQGRYLWVVNNTTTGFDSALIWRVGLAMSTRVPLLAPLSLPGVKGTVYDVFAQKPVTPAAISADLRTLPARLYAILPAPIAKVTLRAARSAVGGTDLAWRATVQDAAGKPIDAGIPLRVQLRAGTTVLAEKYLGADAGMATGAFTLPVNAGATVTLAAAELISGREATLTVAVGKAGAQTTVAGATPALPAAEEGFGPHLKEIALSTDGTHALLNAMNWDENLYAVDTDTGALAWHTRVGHHFAYGPQAVAGGYAVQGYDLNTAEGYHLYLLDGAGKAQRRFALYGLPKRAESWAAGSTLLDRIDNFAVAPNRAWVAAAGDLGLAVWNADGMLRWQQDWWHTTRKRVYLVAQDTTTLLTLDGLTLTAWDAATGAERWHCIPADTGALLGAEVSADHATLALRADTDNGRVFILRGGKVVNTLATPADALALSPDGTRLAVTTGHELRWYDTNGGLLWAFTGDDTLRGPRVSPDGKRVVVGSELGTLTVLDTAGAVLHSRDLNALPAAAWLPGGDLLVATWMGRVLRLDTAYAPRWQTRLTPTTRDIRPRLLTAEAVPTTRMTGWGNAEATPDNLTPNLLLDTRALLTVTLTGPQQELQQNPALLVDGKPDAPATPWLRSTTINYIDSGWSGPLQLNVDTFHTQLHVTGVTVVEDPAHPESCLRDMRLQYWDAEHALWMDGPYLLSDAAVHTHHFAQPIEAARFRFVSSGGGSWPVGNLRLGELVFHGQPLGGSHPDVVAKRPLATLFDEGEELKATYQSGFNPQFLFKYDDAYAGGKCIALKDAGGATPMYIPPFGHAVPNWDFEIVENPQPGQYRWLQFAWKALSPNTTGMALLLGGPWPSGGADFVAGKHDWGQGVLATKQVDAVPPLQWEVVRVDLWALLGKPLRIQCMNLAAVGGGAAFDQLVLGRTEGDLPAKR